MAKNNYIIQKEKEIAALRRKVILDSAYIGAGFVITLHNKKFSQDEIYDIMEEVNKTWTGLLEIDVNPMQYCLELTGIEIITNEQEKEIINEYFKE